MQRVYSTTVGSWLVYSWPLSAERKIEVSDEQRLQMYVVNGSDGWCLVAVRLIVGVRYLERPLREVLL